MTTKIPIRQLSAAQPQLLSSERFTIRKVEDMVSESGFVHDLHRHDFFFILVLQTGNGEHEIDFVPYAVADHTIFFIRPGQVHRLELSAGCKGYLLEFNSEFYQPINKISSKRLTKAGYKNYCVLKEERFTKLASLVELMFNEFSTKEVGFGDAIRSALDIFLIEFLRQSDNPNMTIVSANSYAQDRFEEFLGLLEQHIATYKQISDYTNMMNLSAYQLNEIIKSVVGKTPSELIIVHILLEAKRYLIATSNQVKEIAEVLGYDDYSYFIRFFKKHMGQSPEAFRQNFK